MLSRLWRRLRDGWASRSLLVGAGCTVLDLGLGTSLIALGAPTRWATMAGTLVGSTVSFLANRRYAFQDSALPASTSAFRYVLVTGSAIAVHGQLVVWLTGLGAPFVPAKLSADFLIFTLGQLTLLRLVVFPRKRPVSEAT
jgi:putative flippase GtrA